MMTKPNIKVIMNLLPIYLETVSDERLLTAFEKYLIKNEADNDVKDDQNSRTFM